MIKSAFSPLEGSWKDKWPDRLKKHDVVYLSPPEDPVQGMPIGTGDIGAMIWTEGGKLIATVNKTDAWDDNSQGKNNDRTAERAPSLSQCFRLTLDFNMPVFDLKYQQDFNGRISLADATAEIASETPFSFVKVRAFGSSASKVIVLECDAKFPEANSIDINVEKWGSRTFGSWYSRLVRDASIGLGKTKTGFASRATAPTALVEQALNTRSYTSAVRVETADKLSTEAVNTNHLRFTAGKDENLKFTIYISTVTSDNDPEPTARAIALTEAAGKTGVKQIKRAHDADWKDFWQKSRLSTREDYIDNIWHMVLYFNNSSCKGEYPPYFCGGIWGWNADFMPWTTYLHWNMRLHIMPVYAANMPELAEPYFRQAMRQYRHALGFAADNGFKGAFFTDVSDYSGKNDDHCKNNKVVGGMIALEFWRHWRYTGDERFFTENAWPVMRDVTRFFADLMVKEADRKYHIYKTQGYEGTPLFDDTAVTLAVIKGLLRVMPEAADKAGYKEEAELARWRDICENIAGFTLLPLEEYEYFEKDGKKYLADGVGAGTELEYDKVLSCGRFYPTEVLEKEFPDYKDRVDVELPPEKGYKKDVWVRTRYARKDFTPYYGLWDSEMAPSYPAELIGLSERDTDLFKALRNQVMIHVSSVPVDEYGRDKAQINMCGGWCHFPVVMARTGLKELFIKELREYVSTWQQVYVQGFGHYVPHFITHDNRNRWLLNNVGVYRTNERVPHPAWHYRHLDNEAMPIACTAYNEALLQSFDGWIRLFPAVDKDFTGGYTLAAADGFTVSAEMTDGSVGWCAIKSLRGNVCKLVTPWGADEAVFVTPVMDGTAGDEIRLEPHAHLCDHVVEFETEAGMTYLIARVKDALSDWMVDEYTPAANTDYKKLGRSQLGLPRMY